jgi:hypothetical protein
LAFVSSLSTFLSAFVCSWPANRRSKKHLLHLHICRAMSTHLNLQSNISSWSVPLLTPKCDVLG